MEEKRCDKKLVFLMLITKKVSNLLIERSYEKDNY